MELSPRQLPSVEASGSRVSRSTTRGTSDRRRARTTSSKQASTAADRDAKRRQKALEKHFSKAAKQAEANVPPPSLEEESTPYQLQPDLPPPVMEAGQNWSPDGATELQRFQAADYGPDPAPFSCFTTAALEPAPMARRSAPEATFTPTAAGLRSGDSQGAGISQDIRDLISEAISQGIVTGLQQRGQFYSMQA